MYIRLVTTEIYSVDTNVTKNMLRFVYVCILLIYKFFIKDPDGISNQGQRNIIVYFTLISKETTKYSINS